MIEQMTDELDNDQLLRHGALEMAIEWGTKQASPYSEILKAANEFYNFLKGNINENVQDTNH